MKRNAVHAHVVNVFARKNPRAKMLPAQRITMPKRQSLINESSMSPARAIGSWPDQNGHFSLRRHDIETRPLESASTYTPKRIDPDAHGWTCPLCYEINPLVSRLHMVGFVGDFACNDCGTMRSITRDWRPR